MGLRERLAEYEQPFHATIAVATCHESLGFADLLWPPFEPEIEWPRMIQGKDTGVIFETPSRVVVIEEHSGELRYYAGGWRSDPSRIYLEQDRMWAEGSETGVFQSPRDAVLFAERFLAGGQAVQDIAIPRVIRHRRETDKSCRKQSKKGLIP